MRINTLLALPALLRAHIFAHAYTPLSDSQLDALPEPGDDFDIHNGPLLSPILIPRVPGSEGNRKVLQHFVDFFTRELPEWTLSFQNSSATTPTSGGKEIPFTNLIATRDPPWAHGNGDTGHLALVAHFDSKLTPANFIGATDSAAPCAMLLHAARTLDAALTSKWNDMQATGAQTDELEGHKGVQILLLDGEEAFQSWTATDSCYGSRSLAEEWEGSAYGAWANYESPLRAIDLFVLLDLLGAPDPRVPSYFKTTHWAYQKMATAEERLRKAGKFKSSPNHPSKRVTRQESKPEPMFLWEGGKKETDRWNGGYIGDDHEPFMARGVEILHIITSPFPAVWHKKEDDADHLDMDTVNDWTLLTTAFAAEWLELDGHLQASPRPTVKRQIGEDEKSELQDRVQ